MGALLREEAGAPRVDVEAGLPRGACLLRRCREEVREKGRSEWFPTTAPSMPGHTRPLGSFPSSPSAEDFLPHPTPAPNHSQQRIKTGSLLPRSDLKESLPVLHGGDHSWCIRNGGGRGDPLFSLHKDDGPRGRGHLWPPQVQLGPRWADPPPAGVQASGNFSAPAATPPGGSHVHSPAPLLGHSGWEWQHAPAPPASRQPQVHSQPPVEPAPLLLCPRPTYKSSFSRGTSMLREYQVIQNSRLSTRIRAPV